jgi:hypothetical protein
MKHWKLGQEAAQLTKTVEALSEQKRLLELIEFPKK